MVTSITLNHDRLVRDVMQKDVFTVKFDTPLVDTIKELKSKNVSGLVVVDNIGEFVGVVSALDVFKAVDEADRIDKLFAEDVMTPFTITVSLDESIADSAKTMIEENIHRLIVTESPTNKKPIGIITSTDLINNIL